MPAKNSEETVVSYGGAMKTFQQISKELREDASKYLEENSVNWEFCRSSHNVTIQRTHDHDPDNCRGHVFKAESIIERNLEDMAQIVHPASPYRTTWDVFLNLKILQKIGENMTIEHVMLKHHLLGLVAPREMIHVVDFCEPTDDIRQNFAASIEYPECPTDHKYVRAWTFPSAFRMERQSANPEFTKVTLTVRTDVKFPRIIPVSIIEKGFPSEILRFFERLHHAAKTVEITDRHCLHGWTKH